MANTQRHMIELELGDMTYTMRYTLNSLAEIEDRLGVPLAELGNIQMSMKAVRVMLWAGLIHEGLTEEEVGELVDFGNFEYVQAKLAEAFQMATRKN
ncbi:GTA-gp10 family protein [Desulfotruncus arcticus]|nr:GTA-gp10 family protein [Desulfotruncus arcticus]